MREWLDLPRMSDYLSIKEAAKILGISDKRVYAYVEDGRLLAVRAAHVIMLPREEVEKFKPKLSGRPRKTHPLWRISPVENRQYMASIFVRIQEGMQERLFQMLPIIKQNQEHRFSGTIARYMIESTTLPGTIEILLVWRCATMPDLEVREQELEAFRQAFAEVLDWKTAQYRDGEVFLFA